MKRSKKLKALTRAIGVVATVSLLVSGVTFAALQSQQNVLTGNTIETATANMSLSTDGTNYGNSHAGFDFGNIIPGGSPVPANGAPFYLRNDGVVPLSLKVAVISTPSNPSNVDLSKVNVIITSMSGGPVQSFTLQSLMTNGGQAITTTLPAGNTGQLYRMQASMAVDAVSSTAASLGNIDIAFSGTAIPN